ncbi:TRAP transporter small permease [Oribacterium sp. HCP28S3_H8]|uniref:TRAP transporter small permease n=1 Tax=Oribacterium sp. HCP28S3_H8 TaxID=3438945 RepID=UPI003F8BBF53
MKALKWVDLHFEELVLTVFLIILSVLITVNVVLRYILGSGLTWSEAVCRYCLVYSTFFTIGHWIRRSSGISVDFVLQIVPHSVNSLFCWIVRVMQILFFGFLFISSIRVFCSVYASGTTDGTMGFNMAYIYLACVFGFLDALIRSIQVIILNLPMMRHKEA